jgi:hypothetical protein
MRHVMADAVTAWRIRWKRIFCSPLRGEARAVLGTGVEEI